MISILLATYNGERFLVEQLESILSQSIQDFVVYVQDDRSVDQTWSILSDYAKRYPDKVIISQNQQNTGSAKHNFLKMMVEHKDNFLMLCDQDDVWLPDKIAKTLDKMRELEGIYGENSPLLIHTDLCVVDQALAEKKPSFRQAMNVDYSRTQLHYALIQNTLTGCTVMYNRPLALLIEAPPNYTVMHDWYLMLVAAAFGHIGFLDEATILYRQHDSNEIGAKDVRTLSYQLDRLVHYKGIQKAIRETYLQAQSFYEMFSQRLTPEQASLVSAYCDIPNQHKLARWNTIRRLKAYKNGMKRNIAYFLFV